jgi:hypothetical protein
VNPDNSTTVKVFIRWPATALAPPYFWILQAGMVIAYAAAGQTGDQQEGTAYGLWEMSVWGKAVADWSPGDNFVMVRLTDEDGVEIGYTDDVKCWLYSPQTLAGVTGVKVLAGDLLRMEIPLYDPVAKVWIGHALNVYSQAGTSNLLQADVHLDTLDGVPALGNLIKGNATKWTAFVKGAAKSYLRVTEDGTDIYWGGGGGDHTLLDGDVHTDTLTNVPVIGDLITAVGNPAKWDALTAQDDQSLLKIEGSGPAWLAPGDAWEILTPDADGLLHWFPAPVTDSLLSWTETGLEWLAEGVAESLLHIDRGTGTFAWLAPGAEGSILTTAGIPEILQWLPLGADQSLLYVDVDHPDWFAKGTSDQVLSMNADGLALVWRTLCDLIGIAIGVNIWVDIDMSVAKTITATLGVADWRDRFIEFYVVCRSGPAVLTDDTQWSGAGGFYGYAAITKGTTNHSDQVLRSQPFGGVNTWALIVRGTDGRLDLVIGITEVSEIHQELWFNLRTTETKTSPDYYLS